MGVIHIDAVYVSETGTDQVAIILVGNTVYTVEGLVESVECASPDAAVELFRRQIQA